MSLESDSAPSSPSRPSRGSSRSGGGGGGGGDGPRQSTPAAPDPLKPLPVAITFDMRSVARGCHLVVNVIYLTRLYTVTQLLPNSVVHGCTRL